jgi:hypothetical protein
VEVLNFEVIHYALDDELSKLFNRVIISQQKGRLFISSINIHSTISIIMLSSFDGLCGVGNFARTLEYEHSTTRARPLGANSHSKGE